MTKIFDWIKANILLAIGGLILILFLFVPSFRHIILPRRRVHHRRHIIRTVRHRIGRRSRAPLPRSVGMHKISGRGYPKYGGGHIPFKHNKDGSIKKAKFVAGTVAAHNYMRSLRRNR